MRFEKLYRKQMTRIWSHQVHLILYYPMVYILFQLRICTCIQSWRNKSAQRMIHFTKLYLHPFSTHQTKAQYHWFTWMSFHSENWLHMTKECCWSCRRNHCFGGILSFPNLYDLAPFEVFFLLIRLHTGLSIVIQPLSFFQMVILHLQIQDCWCTVLRKLFWIWSLVLWPHRIRIDRRTLGVLKAICLKFQQNEGSSRECLEWKRKWQALKYTWLGRRSKLCVMSSLGLVCLMSEPKLTS